MDCGDMDSGDMARNARALPSWVPDDDPCASVCMSCRKAYAKKLGKSGKHHCRCCGWAICADCMGKDVALDRWVDGVGPMKQIKLDEKPQNQKVCFRCEADAPAEVQHRMDARAARLNPRWVPDSEATHCMACKTFEFWSSPAPSSWKRHHCRCCGWVVCYGCLSHTVGLDRWVSSTEGHPVKHQDELSSPTKLKKVCRNCATFAPDEVKRRLKKTRSQRLPQQLMFKEQKSEARKIGELTGKHLSNISPESPLVRKAIQTHCGQDGQAFLSGHDKAAAKGQRTRAFQATKKALRTQARGLQHGI
jgi:hypothetical protein